jgi:hypothetical protein
MPRPERHRINPWVLVGIAVGLIAAAFFFYTGHPVRDSNLYSPSVPGWIFVVTFVLMGVLLRAIDIRDRRREAEKKKRDDTTPNT